MCVHPRSASFGELRIRFEAGFDTHGVLVSLAFAIVWFELLDAALLAMLIVDPKRKQHKLADPPKRADRGRLLRVANFGSGTVAASIGVYSATVSGLMRIYRGRDSAPTILTWLRD